MAIPKLLDKMRNAAQMNEDNKYFLTVSNEDGSQASLGSPPGESNPSIIYAMNSDASKVASLSGEPIPLSSIVEGVQIGVVDTNENRIGVVNTGEIMAVAGTNDAKSYAGVFAEDSDWSYFYAETPTSVVLVDEDGLFAENDHGSIALDTTGLTINNQSSFSAGLNLKKTPIDGDYSIGLFSNENQPYQISALDPTADYHVATKGYVDNNGGTFEAIHGVTTYGEVVNAYNQGKTITLLHEDYPTHIFQLKTRPTGNNTLYFISMENALGNFTQLTYYITLTSNSTWSNLSGTYASTANTILHAHSTLTTPLSGTYYRPILVSTQPPSSTDGAVGQIWVVYSNE